MKSSSVGKTYITAGLCFDAVEQGYMAYFKSMEDLITMLKDTVRTVAAEYARIMKSHLLVIDDIMMFPIKQDDTMAFLISLMTCITMYPWLLSRANPLNNADILQETVLTTVIHSR